MQGTDLTKAPCHTQDQLRLLFNLTKRYRLTNDLGIFNDTGCLPSCNRV